MNYIDMNPKFWPGLWVPRLPFICGGVRTDRTGIKASNYILEVGD